jgi:beta-glucanase (GH16 family)
MKRLFFLISGCGICLAAAAQQNGGSCGAVATPHRQLVWSDEFNYRGLPDSTKWGYEEGFVRNDEPQYYTVKRQANCRVDSGMLIIEARKETYRNAAWQPGSRQPEEARYTSASLVTLGKASWRYGRIEVRAKVPSALGTWPAIWLLGDDIPTHRWPFCGEVDIMEYLGKEPSRVYGTAHFASDSTGRHDSRGGVMQPVVPADGFHIYAIDWFPDRMEFYYDSTRYFTFHFSQAQVYDSAFQKKYYLLLNLALGHAGSWAGPVDDSAMPFRYYIDYVRVYRYADDSTPAYGTGPISIPPSSHL